MSFSPKVKMKLIFLSFRKPLKTILCCKVDFINNILLILSKLSKVWYVDSIEIDVIKTLQIVVSRLYYLSGTVTEIILLTLAINIVS